MLSAICETVSVKSVPIRFAANCLGTETSFESGELMIVVKHTAQSKMTPLCLIHISADLMQKR